MMGYCLPRHIGTNIGNGVFAVAGSQSSQKGHFRLQRMPNVAAIMVHEYRIRKYRKGVIHFGISLLAVKTVKHLGNGYIFILRAVASGKYLKYVSLNPCIR